ncbi:heavy-metal-associated domain-containing protein [Halostella sp. JP-L12]|uniref:heavy-metal-associated domain-containing protein n=1 Tax=Halostella TaxID=1843185 RepID=UPI000EF76474|nr:MULTISPECIES: heavy metal-associated domain-containing protein [Halostella]NHN48752.1 heavy-metal-associated domain-containing protein [Halostella sp. JP-L12]
MSESRTIDVTGMSCNGCEQNVEDALEALDGVRSAEANHEGGTVEVVADDVSDDDLANAVRDAGYEVVA